MSSNAASAVVVVGSHIGRGHVVLLLDSWLGRRQLQEHGVNVVLKLLEESPSVDLESWILEVGADLKDVSSKQGGDVVLSPFVVPLLFLESFGDLSFEFYGTDDISNKAFSVLVSSSDR